MRSTTCKLAILILLALPAFGSVKFVGSCTGTTSCASVPAHQVGDLFLAYVGVDATPTAPTLPSGWTSVTTGSINGTSTADSATLLACKVATSTSETITGFTSGTSLVAQIYRGELTGSTATCASTILGTPSTFTSTVNTTTTTVTYNAITNSLNTSWTVGFAYAPAATAGLGTAPTGMTARALAGTTKLAGNDTNNRVASFSSATRTVTTAGRVISTTVEIKEQLSTGFAIDEWQVKTVNGATSLVLPAITTAGTNRLLLVFAGGDGTTGTGNGSVSTITGGPGGWTAINTANSQNVAGGNGWNGWASVWRAFASSQQVAQAITVTLAQNTGWAVVVAFTGTDTTGTNGSGAIGANAIAGAASGAPTKALTTTRNGSWVWGSLWDWSNNVTPTVPAGQTQLSIFNDATGGDSGWLQYQTATTPSSGTSVTINDTAPTADNWNLAQVEILPAIVAAPSCTSFISLMGVGCQ